jgi:hypothetical protein
VTRTPALAVPERKTARPGVVSTVTGLNPSPPITKDKDLTATVPAAREPALTQPPSPATPPPPPAEGDKYVALAWIMGGRNSADTAAHFARLARTAPESVSAGDASRRARLVAAMAELEGEGWTRETARAALALTEPVAA